MTATDPPTSTTQSPPDTSGTSRTSRKLAKEQTRQRLLDAALAVLDEQGEDGLTTTEITRRAGTAQSTFYVHFADMDDLLRALVAQLWASGRAATRRTHARVERSPSVTEAVRAMFRRTEQLLSAHPAVLRLVLRSRLDPSSPLGELTRAELETSRRNLTAALAASGAPHATPKERRQLAMQVDGIFALLETYALGLIDGRYDDLEEVIDVLVGFARAITVKRGRRA
jgi:AcrR family transcriptional regulator